MVQQHTPIHDTDCGAPRVQRLVEGVLLQWAAASAGGGSAHLAERMEELFLEASMLEAVRRGQVRLWLIANSKLMHAVTLVRKGCIMYACIDGIVCQL